MAGRGRNIHHEIFTIADLKEKGSKKLPKMFREYYNEGAMDMITLRDNEEAFNRYRIRPRVLRNVADLDTSAEIFGKRVVMPFGFSPAASHCMAHPDGEVATARAAAAAGVFMGLSGYSSRSLEEVRLAAPTLPLAIQTNFLIDRNIMKQTLSRAETAGYDAVFLTVDAPMLGLRLNEYRNGYGLPKGIKFPNLLPDMEDMSDLAREPDPLAYDASVTWREAVEFIRASTKLQVWIKGVYCAEDVQLAIRYGLDGVIISNHGGRQLDTVPATLDALRECAPVAKGKIPIAIDSGIRRGTDIFKAIALGADFCLAGRVPIWGLAYDGQKGVELAASILLREFQMAMGLAGCRSVGEINRSSLSLLEANGVLCKL